MERRRHSLHIAYDANPQWRKIANCRSVDPDIFFPERGESLAEAKGYCNGTNPETEGPCPVLLECLDYALMNNIRQGIWGGTSERRRRRLRRELGLEGDGREQHGTPSMYESGCRCIPCRGAQQN